MSMWVLQKESILIWRKVMDIFKNNKYMLSYTCNLWANYIETGNVMLSAKDAENCGEDFKALDGAQKKVVLKLRKMAHKLLSGKVVVVEKTSKKT